MSVFTVLGSTGFIGRHLAAALSHQGHLVHTPARNTPCPDNPGHIIYAIGLTGNYRERPLDTLDAHVTGAARLLEKGEFTSLTYLSSTRIYRKHPMQEIVDEDSDITLDSGFDSVYDYSKLYGEALCLSSRLPGVRIARLSNVYGGGMSAGSFLGAITRDIALHGGTAIDDHPDSAKDFISIDQTVQALINIATKGTAPLYNVASGRNTPNREIAAALCAAGHAVSFSGKTPGPRIFATISNQKYSREFGALGSDLLAALPALVSSHKEPRT